jgi:heavy metal efflux system protein
VFDRWIAFCLHNRGAVLVGSAVVALAGLVSFRQLTVEAFPDPTDTQVQVITLYPGQPAEEVERRSVFPSSGLSTGRRDSHACATCHSSGSPS